MTIVGRDDATVVHARKRFGERSIDYRHYLPELARKPQALRQVLPEVLRDLGAPFPAVWARLQATHGDREGSRLLAKILGELEARGANAVVPALDAVLATDAPIGLAAIITAVPTTIDVPPVLREVDVATACAADYDTWLLGTSV